jgi:mannose-6-phosphate isomerase-like protein (cupin superfamily)
MAQPGAGPGYTVKAVDSAAEGSDVQVRIFTLAPGADSYFVLDGVVPIETRAPAARLELAAGGTYRIAPKTAHQISNRGSADLRFLLVQGVGPYDFRPVGG